VPDILVIYRSVTVSLYEKKTYIIDVQIMFPTFESDKHAAGANLFACLFAVLFHVLPPSLYLFIYLL